MLGATLVAVVLLWADPPPARVPPGLRPAQNRASGDSIVRHADGTYEHRDRDSGFVATIHPDGRVTFRKLARIEVDPPTLLGYDWRLRSKRPDDERWNEVPNTLVHRGAQTDTKNDPVINSGSYGAAPILFSLGGRIGGLADWLTRAKRSKARRDFLANTEALRTKLRTESQRSAERRAIVDLAKRLGAIWTNPSLDAATRKRRIFELWDDCAETDDGAEETPPDAGTKAREVIVAFVQQAAPATSRDGFSRTELDRLNAKRRSRARFDPYSTRP